MSAEYSLSASDFSNRSCGKTRLTGQGPTLHRQRCLWMNPLRLQCHRRQRQLKDQSPPRRLLQVICCRISCSSATTPARPTVLGTEPHTISPYYLAIISVSAFILKTAFLITKTSSTRSVLFVCPVFSVATFPGLTASLPVCLLSSSLPLVLHHSPTNAS